MAVTIDGPAAVSHRSDAANPMMTAIDPISAARIAMASGLLANLRAVAAGITNKAVISNTPMILTVTAITAAISSR